VRVGDRGASVVEFVMISVLLVFLLFAVLQVGLYIYARNVVSSAASDGAGYGADHGVDPADGGQRAADLVRKGLGKGNAARIACVGSSGVDDSSGLVVAKVRCRGQVKMIFAPLIVPLWINVNAAAVKEGP
jgi:Flp pilus assembly protein TadG